MCGEANDCAEILDWDQDTLHHLLALYEPKDIFNADETAFLLQSCTSQNVCFHWLGCYR